MDLPFLSPLTSSGAAAGAAAGGAAAMGSALLSLLLAGSPASQAAPASLREADLQRYCQGEAASTYKVSPRDIRTLPVERKLGSGYQVFGQTPAEGESALFFVCSFDNSRRFSGVRTTSDQRASGTGRSEPLSMREMPRFCLGMAAEEFRQNPRSISTEGAVKQPNGSYVVRGTFRPSSSKIVQVFECRFGSKGRFKRVELAR